MSISNKHNVTNKYFEISGESLSSVKMDAKQQIKDMCWLNKVILDIVENYKKELKQNKRMPILHTPNENRNC